MFSTIPEAVSATQYPGRGIIVAKNNDKTYMAYFIMGRSENSRNRVFEETANGIRTRAFDESKMTDPSLVIYNPVIITNDKIIITNGDQTDTIYEFLKSGKSFYEALETRAFEPDKPNFTPRISAVVNGEKLTMSILRSLDETGECCVRSFFNYDFIDDSDGYFIHTYSECVPALAPFEGEPEGIIFSGDMYDFYSQVWDNLNFDNRISLWVGELDLKSGVLRSFVANKNTGEFKALAEHTVKAN